MDAVIVAGTALAALLGSCAPDVAPSTMAAIVAVESAGNSLAINDNTTHRSDAPRDAATALAKVRALIRAGHSVDVGLAQVNSANFAAFHTSARAMLDPCENLRVAARILGDDYAQARATFHEPGAALWHAISAYNTGSLYAGRAYVDRVMAAANSGPPLVPAIALLRRDRPPGPRPAPVVAPMRHETRREMARPRRDDFAVAQPNSTNLVRFSSPSRHGIDSFGRE